MNSIEILNDCGTRFLGFALPMLVQSSLLIVVLFTLDWFIRKRVRAAFRYGLWMLVPIKLLLPPSLALPTGPVYWLPERRPVAVRALARPQAIVPYPEIESGALPVQPVVVSYRPKVRFPGWLMLAWLTGSAGLSLGLARRSRLAFRCTGKALPAPTAPERILDVCRRQLNMRRPVRLKLSTTVMIVLSGALLLPMARAQRKSESGARPVAAIPLDELAVVDLDVQLISIASAVLDELGPGASAPAGSNAPRAWTLPASQGEEFLRRTERESVVVPAPTVTTISGREARVEVAEVESTDNPGPHASAHCEITPFLRETTLDLLVTATITKSGEVRSGAGGDSNGGSRQAVADNQSTQAVAANGAGRVVREIGPVQISVGEGEWVILEEPGLASADGTRLLLIISPRVIRRSSSVIAANEPDSAGAVRGIAEGRAAKGDAQSGSRPEATRDKPSADSRIISERREDDPGRNATPTRPSANRGAVEAAIESLTVNIDKSAPYIHLASKAVTVDELKLEFERTVGLNPALALKLRADVEAPVSEIAQVVDAAKAAKIRSITLLARPQRPGGGSVRSGEPKGPAIGASAATEEAAQFHDRLTAAEIREQGESTASARARLEHLLRQFEAGHPRFREQFERSRKLENTDAATGSPAVEWIVDVVGNTQAPLPNLPHGLPTDVFLDYLPVGLGGVERALARVATSQADNRVWIRLGREAPTELIVQMLEVVEKAGLRRFDVVIREGSLTDFAAALSQRGRVPNFGGDMPSLGRVFLDSHIDQKLAADKMGTDTKAIGFDWFIGNTLLNNGTAAAGAGNGHEGSASESGSRRDRVPVPGDLLYVITKVADKPIGYTVEDYGVVFSLKPPDQARLETRTFRVDANRFVQGLESLNALPPGDHLQSAPGAGRGGDRLDIPRVFVSGGGGAGVLGHGSEVGGTRTNLNQSIQDKVRAFFMAAGVNVFPPNMIFFNDRSGLLMVRATPEELRGVQAAIETISVAPPMILIEARFFELPTETARALGLELPAPGSDSNAWVRVLTAAQTRSVLRAAERREGGDLLTAPKVTTLAGRQTQIQAVQLQTVVNGVNPLSTSQIQVGPTLDVIPDVAADGSTIHLTAAPSVSEFLGYGTVHNGTEDTSERGNGDKAGTPSTATILRTAPPRVRVRSMQAVADVYDGQTLVLANPRVTVESKQPSGASTTNAINEDPGKRLLVFITPTVIDPAGGPIHAPGKEPFPADKIPPQAYR